jgi:aspartate carbamoyltransferase catalytic subunit
MPDYIQAAVAAAGVATEAFDTLEAALPHTDVLYVTRVQKERFANAGEYERLALLMKYQDDPVLRALFMAHKVKWRGVGGDDG